MLSAKHFKASLADSHCIYFRGYIKAIETVSGNKTIWTWCTRPPRTPQPPSCPIGSTSPPRSPRTRSRSSRSRTSSAWWTPSLEGGRRAAFWTGEPRGGLGIGLCWFLKNRNHELLFFYLFLKCGTVNYKTILFQFLSDSNSSSNSR